MTKHTPVDDELDRTKRGLLMWHCSEEDGGPDVGRSIGLGDGMSIWFGEISNSLHAEAGEDASELGDSSGTWIILFSPDDAKVIGKAVDGYIGEDFLTAIAAAIAKAEGTQS